MNIVITNAVSLNGGDAAILYGMIDVFKRSFGPDTQIVVYDNDPEIAQQYYPDIQFRKLIYAKLRDLHPHSGKRARRRHRGLFHLAAWCWQRKLRFISKLLVHSSSLEDLQIYGDADFIVSSGGTILVENYALKPRIYDYQICMKMGKPLAFFTQTLGPFTKPKYQKAFRKIFHYAFALLVRDTESKSHLEALGVPASKISLHPDVVFTVAESTLLNNPAPEHPCLKVAISVRDWPYFKGMSSTEGMKQYTDTLSKTVEHLVLHHGADVLFISTCQGIPEYWKDDSKLAHTLVEGLSDEVRDKVQVDDGFHSPNEILSLLHGLDAVIATRMHVAILALAAKKPVFPIAYEFKTQALFDQIGMGEWTQDIETLNPKTFCEALDRFLDRLPVHTAQIAPHIDKLCQEAYDAGATLKNALERSALPDRNS